MIDHVFILAGGSGTRLWPASNQAFPKQFLKVEGEKSLLQLTLDRATALHPKGEIVIITIKEQLELMQQECAGLQGPNRGRIKIIPEPEAGNTAPAIAVAVRRLMAAGRPDDTILVLAADHLISPTEKFVEDVKKASQLAEAEYLVTFGIPPTRPETGYGYIEGGDELPGGRQVTSFREKPDEATAYAFLKQGNYYWNSGMFAFKARTFWQELSTHSPAIAEVFEELSPEIITGPGTGPATGGGMEVLLDNPQVGAVYKKSPKDSIDYAVMEKSSKTAMVPASFTWNDIGSWDEMAKLPGLNTESSEHLIAVEAENNFVYTDMPVALCGVDDLLVVQKNGTLLICRKGESQLVKKVVERLKAENRSELL